MIKILINLTAYDKLLTGVQPGSSSGFFYPYKNLHNEKGITPMADIQRSANAVWQGDLRGGNGKISTPSGVLQDDAYTFATRFENAAGTNPEELIAAAHSACFSMAFAGALSKAGFQPTAIRTRAVVEMEKGDAGFSVTRVRLETEGEVPNIDEAKFQALANDAKVNCPISRLLTPGLKGVDLTAKLVK